MGKIMPLDSACGINSIGDTKPHCLLCQRNKASTPTMRPSAIEIYWQPNSETVARLTGDAILLPDEYAEDGVQTNLGLIELYPDSPRAASGQPATLMIRPEQFHWCQSGQGVPARVTKRSFRGDHSMLEVEITSMCLNLRMPSLMAPALGSEGHLQIRGACMAYPG